MSAEPTFQKGRQHAFFRIQNRIGAALDRANIHLSLTDLDEEHMYRAAVRSTKLDDFGSDFFREPFHEMLEASKAEGHPTWAGRRSGRAALLGGLQLRLWTQEAVRRHPDILEQPVRRPLIIVGAPRTGTTLLNHLLSLDPAARPLLLWEAFMPAPWRYQRNPRWDPRPLLARGSVYVAKIVTPELAIAHDFGWNIPDECQMLFWPTFVWPAAAILPRYRAWLKRQPDQLYDQVYGEYRRALQMLHWQRPAHGHWVLKSPLHAWALPSLMKMVPEANVIQTHRHLREVIPSFCSLGAILATLYSDAVEVEKVGPVAMELSRDTIERVLGARSKIDLARLCDVKFAHLVADPVGTVRGIYDRFGYDFTPAFEELLIRFVKENVATKRPRHVYSLEQFRLDGDVIDREFAAYHQQFGLESR